MMKFIFATVMVLTSNLSWGGETTNVIPELSTLDGRLYRNVQIRNVTDDFVLAQWEGGIGAIRKDNLTEDSLRKIGLRTRKETQDQAIAERAAAAKLREERAEQLREFAREQKARGLVQHGGSWVTPRQREVMLKDEREQAREKAYEKQAADLVMSKLRRDALFIVIQSAPDGFLCIGLEDDSILAQEFDGEVFFLRVATKKLVADGDRFHERFLFWAGTFEYTTVLGLRKTINCYSLRREDAVLLVRRKLGLFDEGGPDDSAEKAGPKGGLQGGRVPEFAGSGSGFLITEDGYWVTNYHVVKDAVTILVRTQKEGKSLRAELVGSDKENDLALLKVEGSFEPVSFSKKEGAAIGQTVFTAGFPLPGLQGFSPRVTKGVISSLAGVKDDLRMYQIDAAVQPGNSGGPLADANGDIVGVVAARLSDSAALQHGGALPQNVNYALKKSYLTAFIGKYPDIAKKLRFNEKEGETRFEDSVARVLKSTVLVLVFR